VAHYQLRNGNDVAAFNDTAEAEVPLPAIYVVGADDIIQFAYVNADYTTTRAEPAAVLSQLGHTSGHAEAPEATETLP
jgi:hypothetical protein